MIYHITKARKESLDLERDICRSRDISFHVVPYKLKVKGSFNVVEKVLKQMLSSTPRVSMFAPSCRGRPLSSARGRSLTRLFASSQPGEFWSSSIFVFHWTSVLSQQPGEFPNGLETHKSELGKLFKYIHCILYSTV